MSENESGPSWALIISTIALVVAIMNYIHRRMG
jgi:hypothetical protein